MGERVVTASVALRVQPNSRRIYAYLRWSEAGRTHERYLGDFHAGDRLANLRQAWLVAKGNREPDKREALAALTGQVEQAGAHPDPVVGAHDAPRRASVSVRPTRPAPTIGERPTNQAGSDHR
ncbi:hypothetical protein GB931_09425 [Modestobacter sp. I12A-02628]|uniref:Uncharacterized protein n=1 Tax=Goekera deserti TaxID=2497753 RepID=A0A7K3WK40_9ACTN|nr:hypothetical protein [Goekera deserti]MPQ98137.1 hypothetical protein [Goekera deserti]NDI48785.1 hypothetical protein [Goekera deserti]NEL56692.1 hypothetical protein [Goekera deserti]